MLQIDVKIAKLLADGSCDTRLCACCKFFHKSQSMLHRLKTHV